MTLEWICSFLVIGNFKSEKSETMEGIGLAVHNFGTVLRSTTSKGCCKFGEVVHYIVRQGDVTYAILTDRARLIWRIGSI